MGDPSEERAALMEQLEEVERDRWREIRRRSSKGWGLGPFRAEVTSGMITIFYVAFHVVCFIVGVVLITHGGTSRDVGIAVVVGAIFAFGSFTAQWWAVAVQRELAVRDTAYQELDTALWHALNMKRDHISKQIETLDAAGRVKDQLTRSEDFEPRPSDP